MIKISCARTNSSARLLQSNHPVGSPPIIGSHQDDLPRWKGQASSQNRFNEMSSYSLPTNSGPIAVALVIRSKDGPRFVFHYPPRPNTTASQRETRYGTELDQSELEEKQDVEGYSSDSDLDDGGFQLHQSLGKLNFGEKASRRKSHIPDPLEGDDHYDLPNGEQVVPWENLLEFSTQDLESILTPSRAYHKRRFELSLDPLYFVSYPMHIREDGLWKKKKSSKSKKIAQEERDPDSMLLGDGTAMVAEPETESGKPVTGDTTSDDGEDHGGMTMFNVVFVLNIPKEEEDDRIVDIYEYVIKKFSKALRHAQAQSNYVWKESEMILTMKEKSREEIGA